MTLKLVFLVTFAYLLHSGYCETNANDQIVSYNFTIGHPALLKCNQSIPSNNIEFVKIDQKGVSSLIVNGNDGYTIKDNTLEISNMTNELILNIYLCQNKETSETIRLFDYHPRLSNFLKESIKNPDDYKPRSYKKSEGVAHKFHCKLPDDYHPELKNKTEWTYFKLINGSTIELESDNTTTHFKTNKTSGEFDIINMRPEDEGIYECRANNIYGSISYRIELKCRNVFDSLWPFIGVAIQVLIFCILVFIWEKRSLRREISIQNAQNQDSNRSKDAYRPTMA